MPCPRLEASTWSAKEDMDTTGGRGSRVHNRLAVVIGAGSLVVEVATTLAGQAQQSVSERVSTIIDPVSITVPHLRTISIYLP